MICPNELKQFCFNDLAIGCLLPFLYAETHYRFKYFFSCLKKNEPEIITDIPCRIKIGDPLPVLLIIKDADKYPVRLLTIELQEEHTSPVIFQLNAYFSYAYQEQILYVETSDFSPGNHRFAVKIVYEINGKQRTCFADNHRGTGHEPFLIYLSAEDLPRLGDCLYGEMHCHTNYTSDQVEFGASLPATRSIARAMGLDFFCATDHSYDMDDLEADYLKNDPDLIKWQKFNHSVRELNQRQDPFLIIPGEEVTVRNHRNKNVHLLVYNSKKFFPGSGDSGENWFRTRSELSLNDIATQVEDETLLFAAHPAESPPFLQRIFIQRGTWEEHDCRLNGLHGLQFLNGGEDIYNQLGKVLWKKLLLSGQRLTGLAGNDAHGNFSRFRQIGFPFFTMRENYHHLFGKWRTGVYAVSHPKNVTAVLRQIKEGNCFMTNGPALQILAGSDRRWLPMGSDCTKPEAIKIAALSTQEYGPIKEIKIYSGRTDTQTESTLFYEELEMSSWKVTRRISLTKNQLKKGYLRAEIRTHDNFEALSNPIWIVRAGFK